MGRGTAAAPPGPRRGGRTWRHRPQLGRGGEAKNAKNAENGGCGGRGGVSSSRRGGGGHAWKAPCSEPGCSLQPSEGGGVAGSQPRMGSVLLLRDKEARRRLGDLPPGSWLLVGWRLGPWGHAGSGGGRPAQRGFGAVAVRGRRAVGGEGVRGCWQRG